VQKYLYVLATLVLVGCVSMITSAGYSSGENTSLIPNNSIKKINELEPVYNATSLECPESKQIQSHPYVVTEDNCIEKATIKGIGQVINHETFLNTVLENKIVVGQGKGIIISTIDNKSSIGWKSFDINLLKGEYPGYRGTIYFNATMDDKFAFLNNTIRVYKSDTNPIRSIWLWD